MYLEPLPELPEILAEEPDLSIPFGTKTQTMELIDSVWDRDSGVCLRKEIPSRLIVQQMFLTSKSDHCFKEFCGVITSLLTTHGGCFRYFKLERISRSSGLMPFSRLAWVQLVCYWLHFMPNLETLEFLEPEVLPQENGSVQVSTNYPRLAHLKTVLLPKNAKNEKNSELMKFLSVNNHIIKLTGGILESLDVSLPKLEYLQTTSFTKKQQIFDLKSLCQSPLSHLELSRVCVNIDQVYQLLYRCSKTLNHLQIDHLVWIEESSSQNILPDLSVLKHFSFGVSSLPGKKCEWNLDTIPLLIHKLVRIEKLTIRLNCKTFQVLIKDLAEKLWTLLPSLQLINIQHLNRYGDVSITIPYKRN